MGKQNGRRFWSTATLNKKQICFLDKISKGAKFTGGKKLSRAAIIRTLVNAAQKLDIDISGVKSEEQLRDRFLIAFKEYKKFLNMKSTIQHYGRIKTSGSKRKNK